MSPSSNSTVMRSPSSSRPSKPVGGGAGSGRPAERPAARAQEVQGWARTLGGVGLQSHAVPKGHRLSHASQTCPDSPRREPVPTHSREPPQRSRREQRARDRAERQSGQETAAGDRATSLGDKKEQTGLGSLLGPGPGSRRGHRDSHFSPGDPHNGSGPRGAEHLQRENAGGPIAGQAGGLEATGWEVSAWGETLKDVGHGTGEQVGATPATVTGKSAHSTESPGPLPVPDAKLRPPGRRARAV